MCHRFVPLTLEQVEEALANLRRVGRGGTSASAAGVPRDAYPGSQVPVIVQEGHGGATSPDMPRSPRTSPHAPARAGGAIHPGLQALLLTWGFDRPRTTGANATNRVGEAGRADGSTGKVVFNARLDTATRQLREGSGMWAEAIARGRCLIPVRAFFEQTAGAIPKRTFRFSLAGSSMFLLAGIAQDGRFSLVTTTPNAQVAPVHNRMPLVLGPGESAAWLAGDFARLADRSRVLLDVTEEPAANAVSFQGFW